MAVRTITGDLAADPEVVDAGSIQITKLRVIENTGEYRKGEWFEHPTPTTHHVEAKFELGQNAAASLHRGDQVLITGTERSEAWGAEGDRRYGRVLESTQIGASLGNATVAITRTERTR